MLLGRYQVLERIAAGGMGVVYRGVSHGVDGFKKPVVFKRIRGIARQNPTTAKRFLNEALILMAMSHSNIVQILDLCKANDEHFMVLEYVDGADLATLLERSRAAGIWPSQPVALSIVSHMLRGLDYAHRRVDDRGRSLGIVHRDLKPANVLCSKEGEVKLTDFGVASLAGAELTVAGGLIGTVDFMSPEQASGERVDQRSDIFSVGTILYTLLCGQMPFAGTNPETLRQAVCHARVTPPSALGVDLTPEVKRALLTAMARAPDERFEDAASMLRAIEACRRCLPEVASAFDLRELFQRIIGLAPRSDEDAVVVVSDDLVGTRLTGMPAVAADSPAARSATTASGEAAAVDAYGATCCAPDGRLGPPTAMSAEVRQPTAMSAGVRQPTAKTVPPDRRRTTSDGVDRGRLVRRLTLLVALALLGGATGLFVATPDYPAWAPNAPDGLSTADDARAYAALTSKDPRDGASVDPVAENAPRPRDAAPDEPGDTWPAAPDPPPRHARPQRRQHAWGWLLISTRPAYAEVYLRGRGGSRRAGNTPCRLRLRVGTYRVRLVNRAFGLSVTRRVRVHRGRQSRLALERFGGSLPQ